MKAILYLLGGVLVAPGIMLAYFIWSVTEAIRQENLFKFLLKVLEVWGNSLELLFCAVIPGLIIWLTLAFIPNYRWIGALAVAMLTAVSIVEMIAGSSEPITLDSLFLPAISFAGLALNLWLVWDGLPPNSLTGWSQK